MTSEIPTAPKTEIHLQPHEEIKHKEFLALSNSQRLSPNIRVTQHNNQHQSHDAAHQEESSELDDAFKTTQHMLESYLINATTKTLNPHTHLLQISPARGSVPNQTGV